VEGKIDSQKLLQSISESGNLDKFEIPKEVYVLPTFVQTDTGKIRRKENLQLIRS
jgi:O-succinylbenzoic acid--CoA ligase